MPTTELCRLVEELLTVPTLKSFKWINRIPREAGKLAVTKTKTSKE